MSAKSIRAFENAYPQHKPSLQLRLRNEAAKLRAKAQSILAQANVLEEMAAELEPLGVEAKVEPAPRCHCGAAIEFDRPSATDERVCCWCPNCHRRSVRELDGATVFVYGYGRDIASAFADWKERLEGF